MKYLLKVEWIVYLVMLFVALFELFASSLSQGLQEVPNHDAQIVSVLSGAGIIICIAGLSVHLINHYSKK